jgi:hypothetical protein
MISGKNSSLSNLYMDKQIEKIILENWTEKEAKTVYERIRHVILMNNSSGLHSDTCPFCIYYHNEEIYKSICNNCEYGKIKGICDTEYNSKIKNSFGIIQSKIDTDEILTNENYKILIAYTDKLIEEKKDDKYYKHTINIKLAEISEEAISKFFKEEKPMTQRDIYLKMHEACPLKKGDRVEFIRTFKKNECGSNIYPWDDIEDYVTADGKVKEKTNKGYNIQFGNGLIFAIPYFCLEIVEKPDKSEIEEFIDIECNLECDEQERNVKKICNKLLEIVDRKINNHKEKGHYDE